MGEKLSFIHRKIPYHTHRTYIVGPIAGYDGMGWDGRE